MLDEIDVIAWDFDGVLNRNIINDQILWIKEFQEDLQISWPTFARVVLTNHYEDVLVGKRDLKELLSKWAKMTEYSGDLDTFMEFWFQRDHHPDLDMLLLVNELSKTHVRQVIATNNEDHRTRFIEQDMGMKSYVEQIFASGRMGVAKPDHRFFSYITDALGVPPERMLLIDNLKVNVLTARYLGWNAIYYTQESKVRLIDRMMEPSA